MIPKILPLPPSRDQRTAIELLEQLLYEEFMEKAISFLQAEARGITPKEQDKLDWKEYMRELDEWRANMQKLTTK